jgi:hypothetical protein
MVTLVLLSILVLGISGLWSQVNEHFLSLTLRQKAVFVMSGEMERLSALYRFTNFGADAQETDNSDSPPDQRYSNPNKRNIFPASSAGTPVVNEIVTQEATIFDCGANACAGRVFHDENGIDTDDDRAYVWLDQARKITARLSWTAEDPQDANEDECSNGTPAPNGTPPPPPGGRADCQELTIYIEFPFRFRNGTTPDAPSGFGKIQQLSLKTIVGRRP